MSASATAAICCSPSTVATYGRGRAVVVATGMGTEVGRIAGLLEAAEREPTPLQQELDRTGKRLSVNHVRNLRGRVRDGADQQPDPHVSTRFSSLFLFAVALAVAAIPEALPAIVTVGLSLGVRRMAAAHAIVRKLPAVETLGAATVICSDKTGTLTRNEMTVRAIFMAGTLVEVGGSGYIPEGDFTIEGAPLAEASPVRQAMAETLRAAALANDAALVHSEDRWRVQGDPTEGALIVAARKSGIAEPIWRAFPALRKSPSPPNASAIPPCMRIPTIRTSAVFVKGAPEVLLAKIDFIREDGKSARSTSSAAPSCRPATTRLPVRRCARLPSRRAPSRPPPWASIRRRPPLASCRRGSNCPTASRTVLCCSGWWA